MAIEEPDSGAFDGEDDPIARAHAIRHDGLREEYAGRLEEAENLYDRALSLYRKYDKHDTLGYANAVRYPAVLKNLLGKRDEATQLWDEAFRRYDAIGITEGVAEAAAWLTIFAIERNDLGGAREWYAKASQASSRSNDPGTHKFVDDVRQRLEAGDG